MPKKSEQLEGKQKPADSVRRRNTPIKVWLTPEEKDCIVEKASQHGLSQSAYLRHLGMNYPVISNVDKKHMKALCQINADLGRMGGLLKLWLTDDVRLKYLGKPKVETWIFKAMGRITCLQELLLEKASSL